MNESQFRVEQYVRDIRRFRNARLSEIRMTRADAFEGSRRQQWRLYMMWIGFYWTNWNDTPLK